MPLPQAQNRAADCPHCYIVMPLAVAVCGAAACTMVLSLQAAGAAVAVIEAADVSKMICIQASHCAIQYIEHCAASKCKSVMAKLSMPFREVTQGSDPMKAGTG